MEKFILEYKRYAQKFPRQLLRSVQQLILEEHREIMCSKSGEEMEEFMALTRDDFISATLRMHAANSSRKWRLLIKMQKCKNRTLRPIRRRFPILNECVGTYSSLKWIEA